MRLFSFWLGRRIPYSGTLKFTVEDLAKGHARIRMVDRPILRNHLNSIHAAALMNLAELCSGLAAVYGLPSSLRGIVVGFSMTYLKKARGAITAECCFERPAVDGPTEVDVTATLRDARGARVAVGTSRWRFSPRKG